MKKSLFALLLVALLISCSKDEDYNETIIGHWITQIEYTPDSEGKPSFPLHTIDYLIKPDKSGEIQYVRIEDYNTRIVYDTIKIISTSFHPKEFRMTSNDGKKYNYSIEYLDHKKLLIHQGYTSVCYKDSIVIKPK